MRVELSDGAIPNRSTRLGMGRAQRVALDGQGTPRRVQVPTSGL